MTEDEVVGCAASSFHSGQPGCLICPVCSGSLIMGNRKKNMGRGPRNMAAVRNLNFRIVSALLLSWINFSILCSVRIVQRRLL